MATLSPTRIDQQGGDGPMEGTNGYGGEFFLHWGWAPVIGRADVPTPSQFGGSQTFLQTFIESPVGIVIGCSPLSFYCTTISLLEHEILSDPLLTADLLPFPIENGNL